MRRFVITIAVESETLAEAHEVYNAATKAADNYANLCGGRVTVGASSIDNAQEQVELSPEERKGLLE